MAGFLYFRPGQTRPLTRADLAELGLGYAFPGSASCGLCMGHTITGTAGIVFGDSERLGTFSVRMDLEAQRWARLPKRPASDAEVWVGLWKDSPPRPAELARVPQLAGYRVTLADDQAWQIPLVRRFDKLQLVTESTLPCRMEVDAEGNWHRGPVVERYAHLWDVTAPIAENMLDSHGIERAEAGEKKPPELTDNQVYQAIVALLQENYVVGAGELSLLGAITNEARTHAAVMAACDWPTLLEWAEEQKKSASPSALDGSITFVGEVD